MQPASRPDVEHMSLTPDERCTLDGPELIRGPEEERDGDRRLVAVVAAYDLRCLSVTFGEGEQRASVLGHGSGIHENWASVRQVDDG
jgi:hypothetical protein